MEYPPIPHRAFPPEPHDLQAADEALVDLSRFVKGRIQVDMAYYQRKIPGAVPVALLRRGAAERLQLALSLLPAGYGLHIFDAWRPISVQQALFSDYYQRLKARAGKDVSEDELRRRVREFVSLPSLDVTRPSVHNTGGAIDLTVIDPAGRPLDMGTAFDDFTPAAHTDYFETAGSARIRDNRRMLFACMTEAGFTNLPSEWWHYDYGTAFWSGYTGRPAKYKGILEVGKEHEKTEK